MLRRVAVACLVVLPACGGGSSNPVGQTAPPPTPTPVPVSYSGTYSGSMCTTGAGVACLPVTGRTTSTHTGSVISFNSLTISGAVSGTFGGAQGTLNGNAFTATGAYSAACGVVNTAYVGYFSGDGRVMNLRVNLTGCADLQFLGEVSR